MSSYNGETLTYAYDLGAQLTSLTGSKGGFRYPYVKEIKYDRFEQRNYIKYGNDTETSYTYNDSTRNLMGLSVLSRKLEPDRLLMNNAYTYDKVSNVLSVTNSAEIIQNRIGGQMSHHYQYDGLYRLTSANGTYTGSGLAPNQKKAEYQFNMAYDNLHNITGKKQTLEQQNLQFAGVLKTGYDLTYAYNPGKPQQIGTIADTSYRTEGTIVKQGKTQSYSYDGNGNLLGVNATQPAADGSLRSTNNRRLLWDEENRLLAVSDNGYVSNYWYDASGERTLKMNGEGEGVLVNGILSGGRTGTSKYTAYVNPYLVVSSGGQMSKHFYIGTQRVVSQLCSSGAMADATKNPRTVTRAAASTVDYNTKYTELTSKVKTRFDSLGVAYSGKDNAGLGFWTYTPTVNETDQYYYHPDHLGSSSLITNLGGDLVQHIEYVPFGEVFVEERTSTWGTPYKFNAKELDEETGLYYYGARYLAPREGVWLSVDPLAEKYPGVCSYVYCLNNPVKYVDPDGQWVWQAIGAAIDYGLQVYDNYQEGGSGYDAWVGDVNFLSVGFSAMNPGGKLKTLKTLAVEAAKAATDKTTTKELKFNTNVKDVITIAVENTVVDASVGKLSEAGSSKALQKTKKEVEQTNQRLKSAERQAERLPNSPKKAANASTARASAQSARSKEVWTKMLNVTFGKSPEAVKQTATTITDRTRKNEEK